MAENTVVSVTIDKELKSRAERELNAVGATVEESLCAMLRFIAETGICPFVGNKHRHRMIDPENMTADEIAAEVQKGLDDIENGRVCTVEESEAYLERLGKAWDNIL